MTPAYNVERTILKTIESVQKQAYSDFELLMIDCCVQQYLRCIANSSGVNQAVQRI